MLTIREATSDADWRAVRAVRQAVFVEEQACPPEEEWDAYDAPARRGRETHHLLALRPAPPAAGGAVPVGCARWRVLSGGVAPGEPAPGGVVKLERFAVVRAARRRGVARALVARALADARAAGHRRFVLHAQTAAAPLYAAFGFRPEGGVFDEAGIEHVKMTLADP